MVNCSEQFYNDLERGQEFQDFITDILYDKLGIQMCYYTSKKYQKTKGESRNGIEIKYDERALETGNLFIEFESRPHPQANTLNKSGILRENDNSWLWVIGNYKIVFILGRQQLIKWLESGKFKNANTFFGGKKMSTGMLVPIKFVKENCLKYFELE